MKQAIRWALALCILSTLGCAYFNTFYNANRYFNKGYRAVEKSRIKGTTSGASSASIGKADFEKSVDKSLKLLDYYPNCKYVDDALLLLGRAYYHMGENQMALRRFQEMMDRFPESELRFDAELGMAKAYVAMMQFDDAESILSGVVNQKITEKQKAEAYFYRGRFFETKKEFQKAVDSYEEVLKTGDKTLRIDAQYAVGDNCDSLRAYDRSVKAFRQVIRLDPQPEIRFNVEFRLAVALKKNGEYDESIKTLERLLGDEKNKEHEAEMRIEIGDCLAGKGDIDGAITTYRDVIQLKQKPEFTAKAYYALGNLYQDRRKDYGRALENFSLVKKESSRVICADSAEIKARDILRMQALQNVIGQAIRGESNGTEEIAAARDTTEQDTVDLFGKKIYTYKDSLYADSLIFVERIKNDPAINNKYNQDRLIESRVSDDTSDTSINGPKYKAALIKMGIINWRDVKDFEVSDSDFAKKLEIGRKERIRRANLAKLAENPELKTFKKEELDKNLFLLAELYLFRFSLPDSAMNQYRLLVDRFPQSPYALRSLYNMHHIHRNINKGALSADSTLRRILADYPNSVYAKSLRKEIGLQSVSSVEDTVRSLFTDAERSLIDEKNPALAIEKYRSLYEAYPETEFAAKAFYAAAWAYENGLDSLSLAYVLYDSLLRKYPGSPFSEKVRKKVEAVKENMKKPKAGTGPSAAEGASSPADSLAKNAGDTLNTPIGAPMAAGPDSTLGSSPQGTLLQPVPSDTGRAASPQAPGLPGTGRNKPKVDPDSIKAGASPAESIPDSGLNPPSSGAPGRTEPKPADVPTRKSNLE
jgi:tetratricopeptide (TPR) repeat protein